MSLTFRSAFTFNDDAIDYYDFRIYDDWNDNSYFKNKNGNNFKKI